MGACNTKQAQPSIVDPQQAPLPKKPDQPTTAPGAGPSKQPTNPVVVHVQPRPIAIGDSKQDLPQGTADRHLYLILDGIVLSNLPKEHVLVSGKAHLKLLNSAEPSWSYESDDKESGDNLYYDLCVPFRVTDGSAVITVLLTECHAFHKEKELSKTSFVVDNMLRLMEEKTNKGLARGEVQFSDKSFGTYEATFHTELWDCIYTADGGDASTIDDTQDLWTTAVLGAVKMQLGAAEIVDPASLPLPPEPSNIAMAKVIGMKVDVAAEDPHLPMPPGAGSILTFLNKLPFKDEPGLFPSRRVGLAWMAKHTQNLWPDPKEGIWQDATSDDNFRQYCFCNAGTEFMVRKKDGTYYVDLETLLGKHVTRPKWEPYGGQAYFDNQARPVQIDLLVDGKQESFTPGTEHWEYAKLRIRSGLFILASGFHLCLGHLRWANEPQIGTRRHLASIHPINRLLAPHFFRSALVIAKSLSSLTPPYGMLHRSTAFTAESLAEFFQEAYDAFTFQPWYKTATDRGWDDNCDDSIYPAYRDAKALNDVIHNYCSNYVQVYYKSNADVTSDKQLQKYWEYMCSVWTTLPKLDLKTLVDYCSNVIFYNSAWHEQIGNVSGYARDPAALALLIPRGKKPVLGVPQSNILVAYITIMTQEKTPRLLGDWMHYFLDDAAKAVYREFHNNLAKMCTEIAARNATRRFPVRDYDPTYVKLSVSS